ncbi:MAG: hypothetical protein WBQ94_04255 [Terracidiphilus sp.]
MPLSPNITLTATLEDLTGAAAGSTASPAKLRITLCGFGPVLPEIAGTAMLARVGPFSIFSTGGAISTALWGNDQISPSGTYYSIEILDGEDNVVQCGAYVFTGPGGTTIDLSNAPQITPQAVPQIFNMTRKALTGAVPGRVFTVPTPLWGNNVLSVDYKGLLQRPPTDVTPDYTLAGQTVTMTFSCTQVPYATYIEALA